MKRPLASGSIPRATNRAPSSRREETLIDPAELEKIELVVLARMREHAAGSHTSVFHGDGFNFVGLRDFQPGDRPSAIDWAQSTMTNFSPLITRDFEHPSTASMMILADCSASTRCGIGGLSIAQVIARAIATLGLAGAFFQDHVGRVTGHAGDLGIRDVVDRPGARVG